MYYVMQVAPGMEDKTEILIRERVESSLYSSCFHPVRHVRKKFHGEWKDLHEKLLPGYVFIVSNFIEELYLELRQVPILTKLLGKDGELFSALHENEEKWLKRLTDPEKKGTIGAEVALSQILVEQDTVTILSGPLKYMEGQIRKINLHKRMAEVEVEFMNRKTLIYLGIEMIEKKK